MHVILFVGPPLWHTREVIEAVEQAAKAQREAREAAWLDELEILIDVDRMFRLVDLLQEEHGDTSGISDCLLLD